MAEENEMDKLTEKLAETVCDTLCRHSHSKELTEEQLKEKCDVCPMLQCLLDISYQYEKMNDLGQYELKKALIKAQIAEEKLAQLSHTKHEQLEETKNKPIDAGASTGSTE